ncbi:MAG: DUF3387 domain-containing protein, partial [Methanobacterium paludis]|nr:DUF3387 domain-containing protein [Methanobacterium paludis]
LGLAPDLKKALSQYTASGGKGRPTFDQEEAVGLMLEKYEIVSAMFHGFDYMPYFHAKTMEKMQILREAEEHILRQTNGKKRLLKYANELSKAFSLAVPHDKALQIRDDVVFFQSVRGNLAKFDEKTPRRGVDMDSAIKQIVSKSIVSDGVMDLFGELGQDKPEISILSDEFLMEVKDMPQKNLAVETLKKLLNDQIRVRSRKNVIEARSFAELLENSIKKYQNKSVNAVNVIMELIDLAKNMREAAGRGEKLNMTETELAFYDALGVNDSAVQVLGDETLRQIALELVKTIRNNLTIDWTLKESVQAKLRVSVKRVLKQYGYPPDKQKKAVETVLEQANMICKERTEVLEA